MALKSHSSCLSVNLMSSENHIKLQQRNFLLARDSEESELLKTLLKSPLGLAKDLILRLNQGSYTNLRNNLD